MQTGTPQGGLSCVENEVTAGHSERGQAHLLPNPSGTAAAEQHGKEQQGNSTRSPVPNATASYETTASPHARSAACSKNWEPGILTRPKACRHALLELRTARIKAATHQHQAFYCHASGFRVAEGRHCGRGARRAMCGRETHRCYELGGRQHHPLPRPSVRPAQEHGALHSDSSTATSCSSLAPLCTGLQRRQCSMHRRRTRMRPARGQRHSEKSQHMGASGAGRALLLTAGECSGVLRVEDCLRGSALQGTAVLAHITC